MFTTDPFTGFGYAVDRRDDGFVVNNPSSHGTQWALHLKRDVTIRLSSLQEYLVPLTDVGVISVVRAKYEEWLAQAPVEKARRDEERARAAADAEARNQKATRFAKYRREQEEREAAGRAEFVELLAEFDVKGWDREPLLPLLPMLLRLRAGEAITEEDYAWLKQNGLSRLAAVGFRTDYERTRDFWSLIRACAALRDAGLPEHGLAMTDGVDISGLEAKVGAALLTTRGGAYRDIGNLDAALASAEASLRLLPSPHANALLGGIYFDLGDPEKADKHFEQAGDLNDLGRRSALSSTPDEQRAIAAAFLFRKDPIRYAWAHPYIGATTV